MSDEHDRLLAQGPRVAPEPRVATDNGALAPAVAPQPLVTTPAPATTGVENPSTSASRGRSGSRSGLRPTIWRRLIPVFFGLIVAGRALGGGHVEAALFGALAVIVVTAILVRKARQL